MIYANHLKKYFISLYAKDILIKRLLMEPQTAPQFFFKKIIENKGFIGKVL